MKKFNLLAALLIIAVICFWSCEKDESNVTLTVTDLDEPITEPTTLLPGIYVVKSVITISSTLTIPAGTIIKYEIGKRFDVTTGGSINAQGTANSPIIFTSIKDDLSGGDTNEDGAASTPGKNDWNGINDGGTGSIYKYCIFSYGGNGGESKYTLWVHPNSNTVSITYCTFAHNDGGTYSLGDGVVHLRNANVASVCKNNIFYDNNLPLSIDNDMSIDTTNVFHGPAPALLTNKYNGIVATGTINQGVLWEENEVPFIIQGVLSISASQSLTLGSNVVLKMGASARVDVLSGASFNYSNGVLTSIKDDSLKGDTNGDATLTTPAKGDWLGVKAGSPFNYIGVESATGPIRYAANYAPVIN